MGPLRDPGEARESTCTGSNVPKRVSIIFRHVRLRRVCRCWKDVCAGYEGSCFSFWSSERKGDRSLVLLSPSRLVLVYYAVFSAGFRCVGGMSVPGTALVFRSGGPRTNNQVCY